jgi:hypothetical protein
MLLSLAMGRAATRLGRGGARRARPRPGGGGAESTVREILPWHVVEKRLAARAGGHDAWDEQGDDDAGPDSGVHESVRLQAANDASSDVQLSYKVYTVAELDARSGGPPPSSRPSALAVEASPTAERWAMTRDALVALAVTFWRWVVMGSGRPPVGDALRAPTVVLGLEVKALARVIAWRRLAFAIGVSTTTAALLLFAVVTVAALTDDYHAPGAALAAQTAPPPPSPVPVAQPVGTAPAAVALEIDDDAPAAAPPAPAPRTSKRTASRGAKPAALAQATPKQADVEVFIP